MRTERRARCQHPKLKRTANTSRRVDEQPVAPAGMTADNRNTNGRPGTVRGQDAVLRANPLMAPGDRLAVDDLRVNDGGSGSAAWARSSTSESVGVDLGWQPLPVRHGRMLPGRRLAFCVPIRVPLVRPDGSTDGLTLDEPVCAGKGSDEHTRSMTAGMLWGDGRQGQPGTEVRSPRGVLQTGDRWLPERLQAPDRQGPGSVRLAKHDDTDDFFLVIEGHLTIHLRDRDIELEPGELFVVPKGVEHCPEAAAETRVLLIEPRGTVNTGDAGGDLTADPIEV